MSSLAIQQSSGMVVSADELTREVKREINAGREDRKRIEPVWHSNMAFAAGKYWLKWNVAQRQLEFPTELQGRELYSTDVITEYRTTALGELGSDDDRPELLLRRDNKPTEDFQKQLNQALSWGWDYEWRGDDVLEEMRRLCLDLGTSAIRCRFDSTVGPLIEENVPHINGVPIRSTKQAFEAMGNGPSPEVEMRPIYQGRICWEPLSAFNIIVPPGVPNEHDFPWECVVRPAPLATVKAEYGEVAEDLKEDTDIGSLLGLNTQSEIGDVGAGPASGKVGLLKGHVWLFTYYERPSPKYREGRTIVFGSNRMKPLRITDKLPYVDPNGAYCSGIAYFHWWRVTGRFWSRSLVESMKDPQRSVNKRRTQINDIIDRGMPYVITERNSRAKERRGLAMEVVEIEKDERAPQAISGLNPGEWMYHDIQEMRGDLEHATGIRGPRLGENPANVTTYSQLALLNENDQVKRSMILREHKAGIAKLVESSVYDIRTYWGPERKLFLLGEDEEIQGVDFDAQKIPPFFLVKVAKGSAKPRSQAAELKKVEDLWNGVIATGAFMLNPHDWVEWLKDSLNAGQALDLPEGGVDEHEDKAELENSLIVSGEEPPVQYYDPAEVHISIHRQSQIQADLNKDIQLWVRFEKHIQNHVLTAQATAQQMVRMAPPELPMEGEPGEPAAPQEASGPEA